MSDKCKLEGSHVIPCQRLIDITEPGNPRGKQKGIWRWAFVNVDTGEKSRTMFGAKSGNYRESGFIFNYCPMCGVDLTASHNEKG